MLNKFIKITLFSLIIFCCFAFPLAVNVLAEDNPPEPIANQSGGLVPCGKGDAGPADCTLQSLLDLANRILSFAFYVASIIAAGLIVYAGGRMIYYASNNPNEAKKAKQILYNIVIGYFIIIVAWVVVRDIVGFFVDPAGGPLKQAIDKIF